MWDEIVTSILEVIKYTIPALVIYMLVVKMLDKYFDEERARREQRIHEQFGRNTTPLRLQAYERLVLFLERISVDNLLQRHFNPDTPAELYIRQLLASVQHEYEHNLSQQVYCSSEAWAEVKNAKEQVVQLLSDAFTSISPEDPSIKLNKAILDSLVKNQVQPTFAAKEFVAKEVKTFLM